ncbi:hypothetical protein ASF69_01550 [Rhizobium sp. Leaf311]|uniref:hypothetical protein n=1 Tax=Rhizobium sp. Leaf311 TaxID=1736332 RepID=UPI000712981A|nr:hypothetical protein [Rhizobium sp. Leaf311]KQQ61135.1 hypothetical protein ASF69_01550 [Rhizobium sp. Leaf311]
MKIATDIEVIAMDIQTTGGTAFFSREFADKLATHPKIVEAYSEARQEDVGNGWPRWTIYIAEQDGSVTVSGDEAKVTQTLNLRLSRLGASGHLRARLRKMELIRGESDGWRLKQLTLRN